MGTPTIQDAQKAIDLLDSESADGEYLRLPLENEKNTVIGACLKPEPPIFKDRDGNLFVVDCEASAKMLHYFAEKASEHPAAAFFRKIYEKGEISSDSPSLGQLWQYALLEFAIIEILTGRVSAERTAKIIFDVGPQVYIDMQKEGTVVGHLISLSSQGKLELGENVEMENKEQAYKLLQGIINLN